MRRVSFVLLYVFLAASLLNTSLALLHLDSSLDNLSQVLKRIDVSLFLGRAIIATSLVALISSIRIALLEKKSVAAG